MRQFDVGADIPFETGMNRCHVSAATDALKRALCFAASIFVPRTLQRARAAAGLVTALLAAATPVAAQAPLDTQGPRPESAAPKNERPIRFSFNDNPSLRIGTNVRVDAHFKSQVDWRDGSDDTDDDARDAFDLNRARVGIDGRMSRYVEYQVEREIRTTKRPWRDVFVNVRPLRAFQVQLGRFKMPFSLEQTTGGMDLDFAYRALASTYLAPSRDVGVMAHGNVLKNALKYELGLFREGGDNARVTEQVFPADQRTVAGRIVTRPLTAASDSLLRELEVGLAFTAGRVPEGLNSLRPETIAGDRLTDRVYVNGVRRRLGAELQWRPGPVSVQGEVIRVSEERRAQGIDNEDLPDAIQHGWYVSGTWLITGEEKKNNIDPAEPFLQGGLGALEIAGRLEAITFGGGPRNEPAFPGPRARRIADTKDTAWTLGLNWYLNRFIGVRVNAIRELQERAGPFFPASNRTWSRTLRLQFHF
jgi:phosphate-selective porin OprO/OprP